MTESGESERARVWQARPEKWWWIALVVLIPVLLLTGLAAFILIVTTHPAGAATEIDLARTALSVGGGTGGVVALVLASRRQWHTEQAQAATERDAAERRITELYGKAVEQLGSEKAAVRLGGLYALERLAEDNESQRRTIVDVICAYLRMPYQLPGKSPGPDATTELRAEHRDQVEERQVRLAAQHILTRHLYPYNKHAFWPNTDLNLTGATLINFNMANCRTNTASFDEAQFIGFVTFDGAQFSGTTSFDQAEFNGAAEFGGADFNSLVMFNGARFSGPATFSEAQFSRADFGRAKFSDFAIFIEAEFNNLAVFAGAKFSGPARFNRTQFALGFNQVKRHGQVIRLKPCWVRLDIPPDHVWPQGWSVIPTERPDDATDGEWGLLVDTAPAEEPNAPSGADSTGSHQPADE